MTDRQRMFVGTHIQPDNFRPEMWPAHDSHDIAAVDILDGLRIQTDSAEVFFTLASMLIAAAHSIDDAKRARAQALDRAAAAAVNSNRATEPFGTIPSAMPARVTSSTAPEPFDTTDAA